MQNISSFFFHCFLHFFLSFLSSFCSFIIQKFWKPGYRFKYYRHKEVRPGTCSQEVYTSPKTLISEAKLFGPDLSVFAKASLKWILFFLYIFMLPYYRFLSLGLEIWFKSASSLTFSASHIPLQLLPYLSPFLQTKSFEGVGCTFIMSIFLPQAHFSTHSGLASTHTNSLKFLLLRWQVMSCSV